MAYQGQDDDLRFILAAAEELKQYLESSVIFWPLRGGLNPLTPANLTFAQYRLGDLNGVAVRNALNSINASINTHPIRWEKRIEDELPIRVNQFASLVEDILEYGDIDATYDNSISVRVKITLLLQVKLNPVEPALLNRLSALDRTLESKLKPGNFIWDASLQEKFPPEMFGYLYVLRK